MKRLLVILALCLGAHSAQAVRTEFTNITMPGADNEIYSIAQDSQGGLWIGAKHGLSYYDGHHFRTFIHPGGSAYNAVQAILQLDPATLCLATDNGIAFFDRIRCEFKEPDEPLLAIGGARSLAIFGGRLWIGTWSDGLFRYDLGQKSLEEVPIGGFDETLVYDLCELDGKLYAASYEALSCFDPGTGVRYRIPLKESPVISSLVTTADGRLCVGAGSSLYIYDPAVGDMHSFSFGNCLVKRLARTPDGRIAAGTDSGLFFVDIVTGGIESCVHHPGQTTSLANNMVSAIFPDREGNLWIGTARGISCLYHNDSARRFGIPEITGSPEGNIISSIITDSKGGTWLGGDSGLIHIDASGQATWFSIDSEDHHLENNRIHSVFEDSHGTVWIATDASVARYDGGQFVFCHLTDGGIYRSEWAYDIAEDASGRLWIGTYKGGIYIVDGERLRHFDGKGILITDGIFDSQVLTSFYLIREGDNIWATTGTGIGLARINTQSRTITPTFRYMDAMTFDGSNIWYTGEGKVFRFETATMKVDSADFQSSARVIPTLAAENGRIWFSDSDGVYWIDRSTMQVFPAGISSRHFRSSYYDRRQGRMLWGGDDCMVAVDLSDFQATGVSHKVFITGIVTPERALSPASDYSGEDLQLRNRISLKRGATNVYFELSSLRYSDDKETFYYRLQPDGEWTALFSGDNRIPFLGRSGGRYTLEVADADPSVFPDTIVNAYTVLVPYPLLLSPVAIVLYLLLLAGIIAAVTIAARRRNRHRLEEQERRKTLEMADVKMRFFEDVAHELRGPLKRISSPVEQILENCSDPSVTEGLESVRDNAKRLSLLVRQMTDFSSEVPPEPERSNADTRLLEAINSAIEEHMGDDGFSVSALAKLLNMDQKGLYRKMVQISGMSPVTYIRKMRMRRAAVLLRQGRFTVSEVMYMVGYNNASYFSKAFADEYGSTPRRFMESGGTLSEKH